MKLQIPFMKIDKEKGQKPYQATEGAACHDLFAASETLKNEKTGPIVEYGTGIAVAIPKNHVGLVFPRSSVTAKTTLMLGNGIGVIDSDYRGEIKFQFRQVNPHFGQKYKVGDRIGQIMILPVPFLEFIEKSSLSETERGSGGFGSSGE